MDTITIIPNCGAKGQQISFLGDSLANPQQTTCRSPVLSGFKSKRKDTNKIASIDPIPTDARCCVTLFSNELFQVCLDKACKSKMAGSRCRRGLCVTVVFKDHPNLGAQNATSAIAFRRMSHQNNSQQKFCSQRADLPGSPFHWFMLA